MKAALVLALLLGQNAGLKELLDAAEKNNVDVQTSEEQKLRAAADYRQAWTSLLPSLSAQAGWTHNQYEAAIQPSPINPNKITIIPYDQFDAAFRFDLPLINTGLWMRMGATAHAEEAARHRQQLTQDQVRRAVISSWYGYAAAQAVHQSARRSLGVAQEQEKLQDIRFKAGAIAELDVMRSRSEVQRNLQIVADTNALIATTRRTLRTLTGIEPAGTAQLPEDDLTPEATLEELEAQVDALPLVKAAQADAAAAGKLQTAQQLAIVPVVGAQFTERLTNATGFAGQAANYNFGITLNWRLDVPTFMAMESQRAQAATARLNVERNRLLSRDQINSDWQRHTAAIAKVQATKVQVEASQRAAQVARDRYAVGATTQLDLLTAERDLLQAEVAQIQARTELASARASVRISSGLPMRVQ